MSFVFIVPHNKLGRVKFWGAFFFFFFFLATLPDQRGILIRIEILMSQLGMKPVPPAVEAQF